MSLACPRYSVVVFAAAGASLPLLLLGAAWLVA
jgi:hypothetical protein